ncbi:MAG: hypothetical protein H7203_13200 [Rhizobacter sp.]|nr:hypothetical protein [Burkholderiales bacterium]
MPTSDLIANFIGGPLHGQTLRLPTGTVQHEHYGVVYEVRMASARISQLVFRTILMAPTFCAQRSKQ